MSRKAKRSKITKTEFRTQIGICVLLEEETKKKGKKRKSPISTMHVGVCVCVCVLPFILIFKHR